MNIEQLLGKITDFCETLRLFLQRQEPALQDFSRRLLQITQQLHKNIPVRDKAFADEFNSYVKQLRAELDDLEPVWAQLRAQLRQVPDKDLTSDWALLAKGLNSRAKVVSVACDEFSTTYDIFIKHYKNFTAAKLHVWLLTSCQADICSLTGKVLFLARELARKTGQNRSLYER